MRPINSDELGYIIERLRGAIRRTGVAIRAILLNPSTYLVLYLSTILGFAWLYEIRADAVFYAPYAKLEPASRRDYAAIEDNIFAAIRKVTPLKRQDGDGWKISSLDVTELAVEEDGDFSFTLEFFAGHFTKDAMDASVGGPVENIRVSRRRIEAVDQVCRPVTLPPDAIRQPMLEGLFKQSPNISMPVLCWSYDAESQFHAMGSGWFGDPKAFSGSYWRMLYLSAITITSVGYGDIVPISNTARLLCGLEAVLGWVIAGLFLSALAARTARRGA